MSTQRLHLSHPRAVASRAPRAPLGRYLVDAGVISSRDLLRALALQQRVDAPLGEILVSEGMAHPEDILIALAEQHHAQVIDLERDPCHPALRSKLPAALCLTYQAVPWMMLGDVLLVATSAPHRFDDLRRALGQTGPQILPVVAARHQINTEISRLYGAELAGQAATRVTEKLSCRSWNPAAVSRRLWPIAFVMLLVIALSLSPLWTLTVAMLFAFVTLLMTMTFKAAAVTAQVLAKTPEIGVAPPFAELPDKLPRVSILVPLLREREIAGALIERLTRLTYPKSQLDVILVLEAGDDITRDTLSRTDLPQWISVIEVPEANKLTTKPRALNYALDFCRGSIIGVWDAEDAPAPDQIERVVSRFAAAPARVVCLQGILDYYNANANWLSRCFTIEYAAWWRVLLPGAARLGLVLPLGGTTLFFRRFALEALGGWDAHNVTEDADLGVRLARAGCMTELLPTVTHEEANCRPLPWVRQRSRWLKGFLITWCVHMRQPRLLLRDLGWRRFLGVQTMLFATVCQFLCAPLLWSFWLAVTPIPHPIALTLGSEVLWAMVVVFILAATLNLGISLLAVSGPDHRHLRWWVFTTPLYFTLGFFAACKGVYEAILTPFYWDKTQHGVTPLSDQVSHPAPAVQPLASAA